MNACSSPVVLSASRDCEDTRSAYLDQRRMHRSEAGSPHGGWRPMAASRQSTREHELRASAWVRGMSGRAGFGYARVTGRSVDNDAGRGGNFLADSGRGSSPEANSELRLPDPDVTTRPAVKVRFAPYRDRRWLSPTGVWLTRLCTGAYPSYARM